MNFKTVLTACLSTLTLAMAVTPAKAAVLTNCDYPSSAEFIVEPWEKNTKTFYKGKVRIVNIDTYGEPACCSAHVMILMPSSDDPIAGRQCLMLSQSSEKSGDRTMNTGFYSVDFQNIKVSYNEEKGLRLDVPYRTYTDDGQGILRSIGVRLNLRTEKATLE